MPPSGSAAAGGGAGGQPSSSMLPWVTAESARSATSSSKSAKKSPPSPTASRCNSGRFILDRGSWRGLYNYASKILSSFSDPVAIVLMLAILALLGWRNRGPSFALLLALLIVLGAFSSPLVAAA